jgi:hypothetical protein
MARRYLTLIRYEEEGMARCYRYTGLAYAQVNEDDSTFQPAQSA